MARPRKPDGTMGLMDVLRKLGILQSGSHATTYTSAKDRPIEFQHDGLIPSGGSDEPAGADDDAGSDDGGDAGSSDD